MEGRVTAAGDTRPLFAPAKCRACGAPVRWVLTGESAGLAARAPGSPSAEIHEFFVLDLEPYAGEAPVPPCYCWIIVEKSDGPTLAPWTLTPKLTGQAGNFLFDIEVPRYRTHWVSCPDGQDTHKYSRAQMLRRGPGRTP
jgi:hypothetical protein